MEFKAFVLCLAFFVVTTSGATVCKCAEKKETVSKYSVEVDDGKTKVNETVEIDTEKETERIHVPDNGDTDRSSPGEVDAIFDFKQNMAMHRLSNQKACFLSNTTDKLPKPADLQNLLEAEDGQGSAKAKTSSTTQYVITGTLNDRSILSDEMADLCAKFPIYLIKEDSLGVVVANEKHLQRQKRRFCFYVWVRYCFSWGCFYVRVRRCW